MDLSFLRPVYEQEGPYATVYLEGRSPGEDSEQQIRLRWKALRERLAAQEATRGALEAVEVALTGEPLIGKPLTNKQGEKQTNGRVLIANDGGVVLDEPWDAALGAGDDAHWTDLPELGAYVRERLRAVRMLVVLADQEGAQVRQEVVARQHTAREVESDVVEGGANRGVHKPRGGALKHNQIQRRADEALHQNVQDIAAYLHSVAASFQPAMLVLAGEVQARTVLRDALSSELAGILVETERGARDDNASDKPLFEQLRELAGEHSASTARQRVEDLGTGLAHATAVQGVEQVSKAAEMGAVNTLLVETAVPAEHEAFLIKMCAQTSSRAEAVEDDTGLRDGVAALLRFPLNQ